MEYFYPHFGTRLFFFLIEFSKSNEMRTINTIHIRIYTCQTFTTSIVILLILYKIYSRIYQRYFYFFISCKINKIDEFLFKWKWNKTRISSTSSTILQKHRTKPNDSFLSLHLLSYSPITRVNFDQKFELIYRAAILYKIISLPTGQSLNKKLLYTSISNIRLSTI